MTSSDVFLEAESLSISFPVAPAVAQSETEVGGRIVAEGRRLSLLAVSDVSFRLEPGDSLGLIGHNGSGKTTLLQLLAGILAPTHGTVRHLGTIGNAINTSIGFRPEATGRHNIRLKSIIEGRHRADLARTIEDVEEFANLGPYLDMPMRTYSAGMRARLAFGIATAFHYDILILDEWLGAGDKNMRRRAAERMNEFVERSKITVLASHRGDLLSRVCNKGIVMKHGAVMFSGPIEDALAFYDDTD